MLARAQSVAVLGMEGHPVDVEVSIGQGIPAFTIVGLPDVSVMESRERVRAAIQHSKEKWPDQRITVNLSPAHLRKAGSGFDLAIAVGIVAASNGLAEERLRNVALIGELSLDGAVRRIRGALAATLAARSHGRRAVVVPRGNAAEASLVDGIDVLPVEHLSEAVGFLRGRCALEATRAPRANGTPAGSDGLDLDDVRGQGVAKRALEIAAAGGHNLMMQGTPGGGKTMLARRLPSILPPMTHEEALEVTRIYSVAGLLDENSGLLVARPFRAPHHTISTTGLIGGGSSLPHPGEISLAHRGVLFLDEATEFHRDALEAMRGPIEDGNVTIVRSRYAVTYPSRFQLVLAANPCPCGFYGDAKRACECLPGRISAYRQRLSGPITDRIDLQVTVSRLDRGEIFKAPDGDGSAIVAARVRLARERQQDRLGRFGLACNADVPASKIISMCRPTPAAISYVERYVEDHLLTGRAAHRMLRVGRTIADLAGAERVEHDHVHEATRFKL